MVLRGNHDGNTRHRYSERGHDLYETPREAVLALLAVERVPRRVWEPACGPGAIVRVLKERRHDVLATDLVDYRSPLQDADGIDFLSSDADGLAGGRAIVTNPPYMHAVAFVRRALELSPWVAMLLRLAFITGTTRGDIMDFGALARVHVFSKRLPMMHRNGWKGPKASARMDFAWFVWDRRHLGPTVINRVLWTQHA
jgi:hypothetical protein